MLVDVKTKRNGLSEILAAIANGQPNTKYGTGLYGIAHHNFNYSIDHKIEQYPRFENGLNCYGVCDSPEQVVEKYKDVIHNPDKKYCIAFTKVTKEDEPSSGGWRWHKWGPYIGTHEVEFEYLYDEFGIEFVYCYHIYEILD